jgi:outer membrane scaffolding protein for murein synthesis (MipA/OmpV family)
MVASAFRSVGALVIVAVALLSFRHVKAADYEVGLAAANAMRWQSDGNWSLNLGVGLGLAPTYQYARDKELVFLPLIEVDWRGFAFASTQRGVGVNLLRSASTIAGARITYDWGRKSSDDDFLSGTVDVEATPQVGGFWTTYLGAWRFTADLKYATSSYKGIAGSLGIAHGGQLAPATSIIAGIDTHFADRKYNGAYFDVANRGFNDVTPFLSLIHAFPSGLYVTLDGRIALVTGPAGQSDLTAAYAYSAASVLGWRF